MRRMNSGGLHGGSVTRGVGTTLYMSPEQRAMLPYDHKVDVYSAGIIFFEMVHPVDTQMERVTVLGNLQRRELPRELSNTQVGDFVLWLTSEKAADRPNVDAALESPFMAPPPHPGRASRDYANPSEYWAHPLGGAPSRDLSGSVDRSNTPHSAGVRVVVERKQMHELMPAVHAAIDAVQRVRSFAANSAEQDEEKVCLDYFLESVVPSSGDEGRDASVAGLRHEEQRAALEALRETVERLPGVSEMMHLTPRLSPSMPSPSASIDGVLPEELRLPPIQRVGGGSGSLSSTGGGGGMAGGAAANQRTVLVVPKA